MNEMTIREAFNIIEGLFLVFGAWYFYRFRTGKVNYEGEREEKRKEIIKKYGPLFYFIPIVCLICGIYIIILTLF